MENQLPQKLITLRKHYNFSQAYVANMIQVSPIEYMGFENGRLMCNLKQIKLLCQLYEISLDELMRNDQDVTLKTLSMQHQEGKKHIKKGYILIGLLLGLCLGVIYTSFFMNKPKKKVLVPMETKVDVLSASNRFITYIDQKGMVFGQGDNNKGQLDFTSSDMKARKVVTGVNYSVVLYEDGQVRAFGFSEDYAKELDDWKDVVDIASGDGHIVGLKQDGTLYCVGDRGGKQCKVDALKDITFISASRNSTVAMNRHGQVFYAGESKFEKAITTLKDIKQIAIGENMVAVIKSDLTVECLSQFNGCNSQEWKDIVDIAIGDGFVVALNKHGSVFISIANVEIEKQVQAWSQIKAIDAGKDYIIAYDGIHLYGAGNNTYNQFIAGDQGNKTKLASPENLVVKESSSQVFFTWDNVKNASHYEFSINLEGGYNARVDQSQLAIDAAKFKDGQTYKIVLSALPSDQQFYHSNEVIFNYTYFAKEETSPTTTTSEDPVVIVVPIKYTIAPLIGKNKEKFETYLTALGVVNITGSESEELCQDQEVKIVSVTGIHEGMEVSEEQLKNLVVEYTYCKIVNTEESGSER